MTTHSMSRREFARLFAMGGSAAILSHQTLLGSKPVRMTDPITSADTVDWKTIRSQFLCTDANNSYKKYCKEHNIKHKAQKTSKTFTKP